MADKVYDDPERQPNALTRAIRKLREEGRTIESSEAFGMIRVNKALLTRAQVLAIAEVTDDDEHGRSGNSTLPC